MEPDRPPGVGDHADLLLKVPDVIGVVLVAGGEGEEVETRPGAILLLEVHDLLEVAEGELL